MKVTRETTEYQSASPGAVGAVCTRIIDLGTQETTWQGKVQHKRKIMIGWEVDEAMDDGRPYMVFSTCTLSFHENSILTGILKGWLGKEPDEGMDMRDLIGKPCLLNLVQNDQYLNVASVSPLPKGMSALEPQGDLIFFELEPEDGPVDWTAFETLSDRMRDRIRKSPEYGRAKGGGGRETDMQSHGVPANAEGGPADFDDDIPFS